MRDETLGNHDPKQTFFLKKIVFFIDIWVITMQTALYLSGFSTETEQTEWIKMDLLKGGLLKWLPDYASASSDDFL